MKKPLWIVAVCLFFVPLFADLPAFGQPPGPGGRFDRPGPPPRDAYRPGSRPFFGDFGRPAPPPDFRPAPPPPRYRPLPPPPDRGPGFYRPAPRYDRPIPPPPPERIPGRYYYYSSPHGGGSRMTISFGL